MKESRRKNVFISHHSRDDEAITKFSELLRNRGYEIRNSAPRVKPANQARLDRGDVKPEVIRRLLHSKIVWSGCVVVLIGDKTHERPWVNWEIEHANRLGKRLVGVFLRGGTDADVPPALRKYSSTDIVGWNSEKVIAAIEGEENLFEDPKGQPRLPVHAPTTTKC